MKKAAGLLLLGLAACSEGPSSSPTMSVSGRLQVAPEYQSIVGGQVCTAKAVKIVLGTGMYADLSCPKGEFQSIMECPGFSINEGETNCPDKSMHLILKQNGQIVSERRVNSP